MICGFAGMKLAVCRIIPVSYSYRDRFAHFSFVIIPEKAQRYC